MNRTTNNYGLPPSPEETTLDALICQLQKNAKLDDSIDVEPFDATLSQIAEMRDPKAIGLLIPFFDDSCRFQEAMYSICHTIEMFDDETYVSEILRSLPAFWKNSPKWAKRIHYAIFNSPPTRATYLRKLRDVDDPMVKTAVKELIADIAETQPKFAEICVEVLAAL